MYCARRKYEQLEQKAKVGNVNRLPIKTNLDFIQFALIWNEKKSTHGVHYILQCREKRYSLFIPKSQFIINFYGNIQLHNWLKSMFENMIFVKNTIFLKGRYKTQTGFKTHIRLCCVVLQSFVKYVSRKHANCKIY